MIEAIFPLAEPVLAQPGAMVPEGPSLLEGKEF